FLRGDWQVGFSSSWSSGLPYSIVTRAFALDDLDYPQFRTFYGFRENTPEGSRFRTIRRDSLRNPAVYDLNMRMRKSFVLGRRVGSLSLEVFNLLNTDDLRIITYQPAAGSFDPADPTTSSALQIDGRRRFGRRFQ